MKITNVFLISVCFALSLVSTMAEETMKLLVGGAEGGDPITLVIPKMGEWNSQTAALTDHSRKINIIPIYYKGNDAGTSFRDQLIGFVNTDKESINLRPSIIAASQNIMTFSRKTLTGGLSHGVCRVFRTAKNDGNTLDRFVILRISGTTSENHDAVMKELVKMLGETKIEGE